MATTTTTETKTSSTALLDVEWRTVGNLDLLAARKREQDVVMMREQQYILQDDITTNNNAAAPEPERSKEQPSRFLSLPPELRNEIYNALFPPQSVERIKPDYAFPGFLLANKQIAAEATGLYYANTIFRCLDEASAVSWLVHLPSKWLELVEEVRYDTRWIIFETPFIPVPGAEGWLYRGLIRKLTERGFDINQLGARVGADGETFGDAKLKVSFYGTGGLTWTDKPGLIDVVRGT